MQSAATGQTRGKINPLLLAYIAFVTLGLPASLVGVAWPTLRADFSVPLDAIGLLFISSTAGNLVSSFFIARLINMLGIDRLLILSSFMSALSLFGYPLAPSWSFFIAMGAIGGFGSGVIGAGLNIYLAAEYSAGQMQWLHACFGIGAALSPLIMTFSLAKFVSWRPGYIFVGILMILMMTSFTVTLSAWKRPKNLSGEAAEAKKPARGLMDYQTSLWETLLRPITWASIIMFLLYSGAELTLGNWTYTLLTEGRGVDPQLAGLWAGGFWVTFTVGRILAGFYANRIRLNTLMTGEITLALVGVVLLWWNPFPLISLIGVFLVGFALAPIFAGLVSSTSQRVGQRHAANTIGIQFSAAGFGGAILPSLAGFLARRVSLETIPVMLAVSLLGLLILYVISMGVKKLN